jgi:hypothetical protein
MVMKENKENESDDYNSATIEEKVIETMISLTEELFHGMGKRSFPTEHHIMFLYKIHEFLIKERPKYLNNLVYKTCFSNWLASKPLQVHVNLLSLSPSHQLLVCLCHQQHLPQTVKVFLEMFTQMMIPCKLCQSTYDTSILEAEQWKRDICEL